MIIFITTEEPHLLATLLTQPHRFYGHFILTQTKAPVNTVRFLLPGGDQINRVPL